MTPKTKPTAAVNLATAGQQILLDALNVEMGALKAILPGTAPDPENARSSAAARRDHDAALDAMFDNMPV